jgi:hypothetical protein
MSYIFNRETVRYVLCQQRVVVEAEEDGQAISHTIELDEDVADSDGILRVDIEGKDSEFELSEDGRHITVEATGTSPINVLRECQVTVREANRLIGIKRANYVQEGWDWLKAQLKAHGREVGESVDASQVPDEMWQAFVAARFERAACLAAVEQMLGVPQEWLSIEGFCQLMPERFLLDWASAVFRLNPHWDRLSGYTNEGEEEKKAG